MCMDVDDSRGGRRATEKGREREVVANEPRHDGGGAPVGRDRIRSLLITNDSGVQTGKKNNQTSQPTEGGADQYKEVSSDTRA